MNTSIRAARAEDAEPLLSIYAPIVRETAISFEVEPPCLSEFRERICSSGSRFPWLVCEIDDRIAGYTFATPHRVRRAYQWSVEVSAYVAPEHQGRGIGRALYRIVFDILTRQGFYNAYAGIALPNPTSVAFHESMGFEHIGDYKSVGFKLGQWHDVGWWGLRLQESSDPPSPPRSVEEVLDAVDWDVG